MKTLLRTSVIGSALMLASTAQADLSDDIQTQINSNQDTVESAMGDLSDNLFALFAHRGLAPADTLGGGVGGFEIALDLTTTDFDSSAMKTIAGSDTDFDIDTVALPKVSAAIGLPVIPLDIGVTYLPEVAGFSYLGAHAKYSVIDGGAVTPAVAITGNYSSAAMEDAIEVTTMGVDASVSKGFGVGIKVVPFAGVGYLVGTTTLNDKAIPTNSDIKTEYNSSGSKLFAGASFQLGFMNFVGQWDQIAGYSSYSGKVGFRF